MDLREALGWLSQRINFEARASARADISAGKIEGLSLEAMTNLIEALGNPHRNYPVIHVTGTNGKGSTVQMITELLVAMGLHVGSFTSPHVSVINERFRTNGVQIEDDELAAVITDLRLFAEPLNPQPSYFELLTATALQWFSDIAVDVAVVEVGLLGRYDATNVVDGQVAVVTSIGTDHTDRQGDFRVKIASEKAGIIKPGATLVLGEADPELYGVFAAEAPAELKWVRRDFGSVNHEVAVGGSLVDLFGRGRYDEVFVSLHGQHQAANAAVAVAAVEEFFEAEIPTDVVEEALGQVSLPGRFEVVSADPVIVLDAAHTPEAAEAVAQTLQDHLGASGSRVIVLGMLAGRDPAEILEGLGVSGADFVVATAPESERAMPASEVAEAAAAMGATVETVTSVAEALDRAVSVAEDEEPILVVGSFYVVGEARTALQRP